MILFFKAYFDRLSVNDCLIYGSWCSFWEGTLFFWNQRNRTMQEYRESEEIHSFSFLPWQHCLFILLQTVAHVRLVFPPFIYICLSDCLVAFLFSTRLCFSTWSCPSQPIGLLNVILKQANFNTTLTCAVLVRVPHLLVFRCVCMCFPDLHASWALRANILTVTFGTTLRGKR